jgi:hypothetical protein
MPEFQWNDSHIDWFVKRFKNESKDINAGTVQQNYRRKSGEPTLDHQDYKNLMRLVVERKFARVVQGFFASRKYSICMVSEDYPYIQTVFDEELFLFIRPLDTVPDSQMCFKLFPEVSEQEWNSRGHCEAFEFMCCRAAAIHDALYAQNYCGGDLSFLVSDSKELDNYKDAGKWADYLRLETESFILQYKALKAASPELTAYLLLDTTLPGSRSPINHLHLFESKDCLFTFKHAYNFYFYKIVQSHLIREFWRKIGCPGKVYKRSRSTELKQWGEILSACKDGRSLDDSDYQIDDFDALIDDSDYSQEFSDVRMFYQLVNYLPQIANRSEVIEAVESWRRVLHELRQREYSLIK